MIQDDSIKEWNNRTSTQKDVGHPPKHLSPFGIERTPKDNF